MKKTNFDLLLQSYLNGQLPPDERIKLEAWLDVVKTKYHEELELTSEDEDRLFAKITSAVDTVDDVRSFRPVNLSRQPIQSSWWFRMAAAAVVIVSLTFVVVRFIPFRHTNEFITVAAGEKHILNDGTIVWLQKGSELRYEKSDSGPTRHVELVGGALFEVAKDPANPFTIACGGINVKVLGTSFRLNTAGENVELKVLTGRVNLSSKEDNTGKDIAANESVTYFLSGKLERHNLNATEIKSIIAETEYDMAFDNSTMDQVIARLEKKFNIKSRIEDNRLLGCHITADFTDHSLDDTLLMLSEVIDVTYKVENNLVTLSGSGCNN